MNRMYYVLGAVMIASPAMGEIVANGGFEAGVGSDADSWNQPTPKITFNIVKQVKFGDEIRSAILAEGDCYHMKEVALKPNDFKFEKELGMWTRFYEGEPPDLDETELKRYGWEFEYTEFDDAASED